MYIRPAPGHREKGSSAKVLKLKKALYSLRIAPRLWQKELESSLQDLGFAPIPHEPCCFAKGKILIFIYVDDMVLACTKEQEQVAKAAINALKRKYKLTSGHELRWFLGMDIIRNRKAKLI